MSGGSFEYVTTKDFTDMLQQYGWEELLIRIADELARVDHPAAGQAADEIIDLIAEVKALAPRHAAIQPVMRAVEWWRSCDYGEDQVAEAIAEWAKGQQRR